MVNCSNCGSYNPTGSKFCSNCGNSLINTGNTDTSKKVESKNKQSQNIKICLGLIIIVILLQIVGSFIGGSSSINLEDIEIPNDFSIDSRNETQLTIYNNRGYFTYVITVTSEDHRSPEKISNGFKEMGYILQSTNNIKINNNDIKEERYIYETGTGNVFNYMIQLGDKKYSVSCLTDSETWDIYSESNPVNKILISMIDCSKR